MSSNSFVSTIDLNLRPSLRAHRWLFLAHVLPLVLLLLSLQPGLPMLLIGGGLGLSWLWLRRHAVFGFGPRALSRLVWQADGQWLVFDHSGRKAEAELLGSSCLHASMMVLNFRLKSGARRTRVVLGDELGADPLRRLRARLMSYACAAA
ncbi:MAG TPA: protein YgfX [Solimonas sp.]|nr:protein YgfX [Solimonas sp.]